MMKIVSKISKKNLNKYNILKISDLIIPKYHRNFNDFVHTHQIYTSGRAGTKSSRGALRSVKTIMRPEPGSVIILRKFHNKLKKTVFKECLRAIYRLKADKSKFKITVSPMQITYKPTGNTIYFTGNDSIDDTKGIIDESRPIVMVIIDELTEFFDKGDGEDELQNIEATFIRGNDEGFVMEYYFNPPKNPKAPIMEWLAKMKKRPDCIHVHVDYRDVPVEWLGKKLIKSAEILKELDEKMYNWLWLGLSIGLDDLIYYMFNESIHVKEIIDYSGIDFLSIGVDYGQMNATTYQCFGLDYKGKLLQGIDEYYYSGREEGKQKSPSDYAKDFKMFREKVEKETGKRVIFCFIDPSAKGLKEEIKRICPDVQFPNVDNTVPLGINRVQKMMSYRRLILSSRQKHLIKERSLYSYDEDKLEKGIEEILKINDHCSDAERYVVMGLWRYIKNMLPFLNDKKD